MPQPDFVLSQEQDEREGKALRMKPSRTVRLCLYMNLETEVEGGGLFSYVADDLRSLHSHISSYQSTKMKSNGEDTYDSIRFLVRALVLGYYCVRKMFYDGELRSRCNRLRRWRKHSQGAVR